MLDRIPAEVLGLIVGKIRTQSDLKSLCEVSKYIASVATPRLYESIILHADDMLELDDLNRAINLCCNENVKFTMNICLKAPLHKNLRKRCPHYGSGMPKTLRDAMDMDHGSEIDITSVDPFWKLSMALNDLLGAFEENNLQSLSLHLGCCVPNDILNRGGKYWIEKQNRIQSISLITDGECPTCSYVDYLDLKPFTSIQSLSWKGLNRGDHFDCLESFIKFQDGARGLRSLALDLVDWHKTKRRWYAHQRRTLGGYPHHWSNFFATNILGIRWDQEIILFPSLENLLLAGVCISPYQKELVHSLNITSLSTLQLRNCPDSLDLLKSLLEQGITLKLKSFELAIDWDCLHWYDDFEPAEAKVIFRFLDSFQGLEDLSYYSANLSNGILS